jgi:signal transduction histidine kinase
MLSTELLERQLLDAIPVSVYAIDLDARLTSVHHAAARFGEDGLGLLASIGDDAGDRPIWEHAAGALPRQQVESAMLHLRAGRAPVVSWEVARGDADDRRAVLAQMTPLHDDSHAVTGFVISTTDITATHRAHGASMAAGIALARTIEMERAYHEAAQQIRHVVRADLFVVALVDDDGTTFRISYDSGGDGDRGAIERRFSGAWRVAIDRGELVATQRDAVLELTAPLIGATATHGALSVAWDDSASPEKLAATQQFLTDVAAHTAAAIERTRLVTRLGHERRIDAIGEVASGVAQELRNPIFGISSAAQLLRFRAREDPVMEKNAGRILREVERLNRMVSTLVELGRPVALKLAAGDPDAVWDDVLAAERGLLESRVIALRRSRAEPAASTAIDADQLAQVFRSILTNAVEAAPEASDISLHSIVLPNGGWRCRLTNGGPPIPPDVRPRAFELFVSTKPGSSGIGLALAQRIVDAHHGSITIDSSREDGTTVAVTVPPSSQPAT